MPGPISDTYAGPSHAGRTADEIEADIAKLRALIQDIEQNEPTRELNDRVLLACTKWTQYIWEGAPSRAKVWRNPEGEHMGITRPSPLEDLQDATLAVPEGFYPGLDPRFFADGEHVLYDAILCRPHWDKWNPVNSEWIERIEARADTPEKALVLASLKAELAKQEAEG